VIHLVDPDQLTPDEKDALLQVLPVLWVQMQAGTEQAQALAEQVPSLTARVVELVARVAAPPQPLTSDASHHPEAALSTDWPCRTILMAW
jgi:hypothetical protein